MTKDIMKMIEKIMTKIDEDGCFTAEISVYDYKIDKTVTKTIVFDDIVFETGSNYGINELHKEPYIFQSYPNDYKNMTPISKIVRFID